MIKPRTNLDYVILYAEKLKNNNVLFDKQKMFIESQMKASKEIFANRFGKGDEFIKKAREYLRKLGIV